MTQNIKSQKCHIDTARHFAPPMRVHNEIIAFSMKLFHINFDPMEPRAVLRKLMAFLWLPYSNPSQWIFP